MNKYLFFGVMFIRKNRDLEGKTVLVHCHQGIQRSCTIVAAYLMVTNKMSLVNAINLIISRRPIAFWGGKGVNFLDSLKTIKI